MRRGRVGMMAVLLAAAVALAACGGGKGGQPAPSSQAEGSQCPAKTEQEMAEMARREGAIVSYGMPDTWANWRETWQAFTSRYGLTHSDTDMSSAEELAKFLAEKDKPVADVGDVGFTFGPKGKEMGVLAPHKNPWWDEIPDWAKDPEGYWAANYQGTISFIVNTKKAPFVPRSWKDLLDPRLKGSVSIDDPLRSAQAKAGVLASAFAMGGDEGNIQPGIDFWAKLMQQGNYRPVEVNISNVQKGEVVVGVLWDFLALAWRDELRMPELEVVIPSDATVSVPYVAIINRWAPHPCAARLFNNYLFSDEAQIHRAKGYARPIRNVPLPPEVAAKFPPAEAYASARPIRDLKAWENTAEKVLPDLWESQVLTKQ